MDRSRIRQTAKIAGVSEELARAVLNAERLRLCRELVKNNKESAVGLYGDMYPTDKRDCDVCDCKFNQEMIDIIDGNYNPEIVEDLK